VFRDQYGCWGFLGMWRIGGTFSVDECALLQQFTECVTTHLRGSLSSTFERASSEATGVNGPAILLLSDDIVRSQSLLNLTSWLFPPGVGARRSWNSAPLRSSLPRTDVDGHPPWARVNVRDGLWVTLSAARIGLDRGRVLVTIAVASSRRIPQRAGLYARVVGLANANLRSSAAVSGSDTSERPAGLYRPRHHSDHQSIFAKTGVNSRRMLIARAAGVA
jgi:hypothetical protein